MVANPDWGIIRSIDRKWQEDRTRALRELLGRIRVPQHPDVVIIDEASRVDRHNWVARDIEGTRE